jgi:FecR protein
MDFNIKSRLLRCSSTLVGVLILSFVTLQIASATDDDDPPGRVARLSYTNGAVSFNPAGTEDWTSAVVNRPLTIGDKLWADNGARAELNLGTAAIRLGDQTGLSFLNLDDRATQIQMTEGTLSVRVRRLDQDEVFEIDTPNLAFSILRPGTYRINVNESGDATMVAVQTGEGEVTGGGSAYSIRAGESGMFSGVDQLSAEMQRYPDADEFDRWSSERDRRWDRSSAPRYVSDDVIGYEDLDDYGGWRPVPEYGSVWFPRATAADWAPYRDGQWVWISPWGWTWVDDEPWGFAPFHYGRWVVVDGTWGWVPSPPRPEVVTAAYVRPVYSPALVAWLGGSQFGVAVGSAPVGVAWFPLGPRDVYCPSYHVSERYVERINVSNTTIINRTQVTNVYNNVYVNNTAKVTNIRYQNQGGPNAVTAVSHQSFVAGQPVNRNIVRVDSREVASAQVAPLTPSVAPEAHSVVGAAAPARSRPPAQVMARPVVAKATPPPAPPAFSRQQQAIQTNGGRPIARSQERQLQATNQPAARPNVRMAPPARSVTPSKQPSIRNNQPNQPPQPGNQPAPPQPERPSAAPSTQPNNRPPNQPNAPATPPANPRREDRPPAARPANPPPVNPQTEPKNQPNAPATPPANPRREDRPPAARPANPPPVNPQTEQKNQPQADKTRQQQEQERQRPEQKQPQEQQQIQQRKQQQQEQMKRKPDQQEQKPAQKPEAQKQQRQQPPPKENKPPKSDKDKDKPPQ